MAFQAAHHGSDSRHQEIYEAQARSGDWRTWTREDQMGWINGALVELPPVSGEIAGITESTSEADVARAILRAAGPVATERTICEMYAGADDAMKGHIARQLQAAGNTTTSSITGSVEEYLRGRGSALVHFLPIWQADGNDAFWRVFLRGWKQRWLRIHPPASPG